ncbi:DUF4132 domain-containing protein [Polymorphospora sp. NPDC051019]|uniref:DUF4132 domain-containing protein n=1 Tax=Polymorphospora sp. NPDC051019 TaxID=3155725 RepID=UPI003414A1CA
MRDFEFVDGGSAKFWRIDRNGSSVTVSYGRLGTEGRTQVKHLGSEQAAIAHADRLVAEKVRKGYVEAGGTPSSPTAPVAAAADAAEAAPAGPGDTGAAETGADDAGADDAGPQSRPDEDTLVIPVAWRRRMHPRRGGLASSTTVDRRAVGVAATLFENHRKQIERMFARTDADLALVAEVEPVLRDGLRAGLADPALTARGAAAVAAAVAKAVTWSDEDKLRAFADAWTAVRGTTFAARATLEVYGLAISPSSRLLHMRDVLVRPITDDEARSVWKWPAESITVRMRSLLAAATDDDYLEATAVIAEYRDKLVVQRVTTSYLVPTRTDWVDEDLTGTVNRSRLLWSLYTREQFETFIAGRLQGHGDPTFGDLATVLEAVGPAPVATYIAWFGDHMAADGEKRLYTLLSTLPTDEAFATLLDRIDSRYAQPALTEAMVRFPVRALRLMPAAATGQTAKARLLADLLRMHVSGNPELVAATLPDLPEADRAHLAALADDAARVAEAPAELLPELLRNPPWTARSTARPVVVTGLTPVEEAAVAWRPGERDEWLATHCNWIATTPDKGRTWEQTRDAYLAGNLRHHLRVGLMIGAPKEIVRPLLANWHPTHNWDAAEWGRVLAGRYELDALPAILRMAPTAPTAVAELLAPYASSAAAPLIAQWLQRLKSARRPALAWLTRHPEVAARALVPDALGKAGPARRNAEAALWAINTAGHGERVLAAAGTYGEPARAAIATLVATDPLAVLPPKLPVVPAWADPMMLPPVLLRDRRHALPRTAVTHLMMTLALSRPGETYAGVDVVRDLCDPVSLAEFGWGLFQRWLSVGAPAKEIWALDALGLIGDDDTVRRLTPLIRAWPGEAAHGRAVSGLSVLASIGTDVALMHLHSIAEKVKFKGLKERAAEKIAEVAEDLGLSPEELADRLVPDLGLDADGSLTLDYGPRRFVVGFDEQLRPYVADTAGHRRKELPKPGVRDDESLAPEAYKRFAGLKKDVRTIAADQIRRLERAMVTQRRWTGAQFRELFVGHPLLWHIVRRLVWAIYDDAGTVTGFRVAEDRTLADADDETLTLADDASVGIAHPMHLGEALPAWSELFADYEIVQPFPQLGREVHRLTDEQGEATELATVAGITVPTTAVLALERRGWSRGEPMDGGVQCWMERPLPGNRTLVVDLDPGIIVGLVTEWKEQKLSEVWINNAPRGDFGRWRAKGLPFGVLDPVTASEVLRELAELTAAQP